MNLHCRLLSLTLLFAAATSVQANEPMVEGPSSMHQVELLSSNGSEFLFLPSADTKAFELPADFEQQALKYLESNDQRPARMTFAGSYTNSVKGAVYVGSEKLFEKTFLMGGSKKIDADLAAATGLNGYCWKNALWNLVSHFQAFQIQESFVAGINFAPRKQVYIWFKDENVVYANGLMDSLKRMSPKIKEIGTRVYFGCSEDPK
jgi:hypothetical protein